MLSVKTALSTLCAGRLVDKLRCKDSCLIHSLYMSVPSKTVMLELLIAVGKGDHILL